MKKALIIIVLFSIALIFVDAKESEFRDGIIAGMIYKSLKNSKSSPKVEYQEPEDNCLFIHKCEDTALKPFTEKNKWRCEVSRKWLPLTYANWFFLSVLVLFCLQVLVLMIANTDEKSVMFLFGFILISGL